MAGRWLRGVSVTYADVGGLRSWPRSSWSFRFHGECSVATGIGTVWLGDGGRVIKPQSLKLVPMRNIYVCLFR